MSRIREYLEDHLDIQAASGDEARLKNCLFCDRARTMKVNVETGRFICFNDEYCGERGKFIRLVQAIEECSRSEAIRTVMDLAKGITRARHSLENLGERLDDMESDEVDDDDRPPRTDHPLPAEFIPCHEDGRWRIPEYLTDRRVRRAALKKWGIGYCEDGPFEERIVVPVLCDGSRSFVARKISGYGPKYMTPGEGWDDRLLFGYDQVAKGARVVAVEGVFDAIRVDSYGHEAVAYFGQQLGKHQIDLLRRRRISELVLMPDGTDVKARARALKDAATLAARFPSVVVALLEGGDPDESPRAVVESALAHAKAPGDFTASLRERLKHTTDSW